MNVSLPQVWNLWEVLSDIFSALPPYRFNEHLLEVPQSLRERDVIDMRVHQSLDAGI
jgi:hypothetical protein